MFASLFVIAACASHPAPPVAVNVTAQHGADAKLASDIERETLKALRGVKATAPLTVSAVVQDFTAGVQAQSSAWVDQNPQRPVPSTSTELNSDGAQPTVGGSSGTLVQTYTGTTSLHGTYSITDATGAVLDSGRLNLAAAGGNFANPIGPRSQLLRNAGEYLAARVAAVAR
jgi:hypothetical protein